LAVSQENVERVIGRLVTDEAFRRRFRGDAAAVLRSLVEDGIALNPCELRALAGLDPDLIAGLAERIDPRIQKSDLHGGRG
jgi:hypothetical protein